MAIETSADVAEQLERALIRWRGEWPMLPAVIRLDSKLVGRPKDMTKRELSIDEGRGFVWGRIPLDDLIRYYLANREDPSGKEYVDLGTPIWAASTTAGSSATITNLLAQTPSPGAASVGAALVDLGVTPTAGTTAVPRTFGGKLRHVSYPPGTGIDLSGHAEDVLEVLLDRLSATHGGKNMLPQTTVSMALIDNPAPDTVQLAKDCFDQHCAPEMLDAVKAINLLLDGDTLADGTQMPAVVNMSVGTHVGPHNGQSPLEAYISGSVFKRNLRFPFAAAGNEGLQALSARLELKRDEVDYMRLIATEKCTELLVEFWWDDAAGPADIEINVTTEASGMAKSFIPIKSGSAGSTLVASAVGRRRSATFLTLCQSQQHGTMSCIAFAVTRPAVPPGQAPLPELRISFDIVAKSSDVAIHAWTVICDKERKSYFTRGGPDGTVSVPASDPMVVSVAAFDPISKQMWRDSSRGPASRYNSGASIESPMMAHLSNSLNGRDGTSFASPRAAADATVSLANSTTRKNCTEAKKLVEATYGTIAPAFDPRYGFIKQTS
ncbi:hypothetical protein QWJ07_08350 [Frankia sp. RB7]|nr:hypothetical protein [Frankia sp. RB7]